MKRKNGDPVPTGTIIQLGMRVRMRDDAKWKWGEDWLTVPAGEKGTIVPWQELPQRKTGEMLTMGKGCAVLFDTTKHPEYNGFPMSRHDINWDVLPTDMEAV